MEDHTGPEPLKITDPIDQHASRAKFRRRRHFPKGVKMDDIAKGFTQLSQAASRAGLYDDANKFGAEAVRFGNTVAKPKKNIR